MNSAGFLRIRNAGQPLDNTAVHPERYQLVEQTATDLGVSLSTLIIEPALHDKIRLEQYIGTSIGLPTLRYIVSELKKPAKPPGNLDEALEKSEFRIKNGKNL